MGLKIDLFNLATWLHPVGVLCIVLLLAAPVIDTVKTVFKQHKCTYWIDNGGLEYMCT